MFRKIKHLLRAAGKNKLSPSTNIAGLSIGLAVTILLVVFILHDGVTTAIFRKPTTFTG